MWVNHALVTGHAGLGQSSSFTLEPGANPLLLRYDQVGRGYVVVEADTGKGTDAPPPEDPLVFTVSPLAMFWYNKPGLLPFDTQPQVARPAGWYRFTSPPGLRSMSVRSAGTVRAWADGKELRATPSGRLAVPRASPFPVKVAVRVEQDRGSYGGAGLAEPIRLDCGPGRIAPGDWSRIDGLASYSGGAWYRKSVDIPAAARVVLDLGGVVSTAEVHVNGKPAGTRVSPPWALDISALVRPGRNRIEVLVYNTLANHYGTIPTRYRGKPTSGLLGPVSLRLAPPR
jgi:hypothetical protein